MLRAILWAKAHMSHLESRRLERREDFLQPRIAARSMKARTLIGKNQLAAHRGWMGNGPGIIL